MLYSFSGVAIEPPHITIAALQVFLPDYIFRLGEVRRLGGVSPCTDEGSEKVLCGLPLEVDECLRWEERLSFPLNTAALWCRQLACWVDGEVGDRPPPEDGGK
ncbi:hypothetical protein QYF61_027504 [Mycteria americana]|uniref:Uncharacterized protein n=1 Tax=Mycteria americana TaxID=33587 RepID=A0AAN7MFW7_MYCAM|nr:hypothetical protein QYF61_027504 [Mycteria americana]